MKIAILGAGNWGTTMALILAGRAEVSLWTIEVIKNRENKKYLPGYKIPDEINITYDIEKAVKNAGIVIFAVPSQTMREVARLYSEVKIKDAILVSAVKGLEKVKLKYMSEVLMEEIKTSKNNICVLSGPTIAREVIKGIPTSCVCAGKKPENTRFVQKALNSPTFRVYTGTDIVGVELGGALKNVIAIASGICDGLGLGANTKGALLTRGIKEITRLGVSMGAEAATFAGLSGIGDLITTSFSVDSRNRKVGEMIGKGYSVDYILEHMVEVAEGIPTVEAAKKLSVRYKISMPITCAVYEVLFENKKPLSAMKELMLRELKAENI